MSDTPRTDAIAQALHMPSLLLLARQLERELSAARAEMERLRELANKPATPVTHLNNAYLLERNEELTAEVERLNSMGLGDLEKINDDLLQRNEELTALLREAKQFPNDWDSDLAGRIDRALGEDKP